MNVEKRLLPIEKSMVRQAQQFANMSGKPWEIFRDGRGAVDLALVGTCAQESKFKLIMTVEPQMDN